MILSTLLTTAFQVAVANLPLAPLLLHDSPATLALVVLRVPFRAAKQLVPVFPVLSMASIVQAHSQLALMSATSNSGSQLSAANSYSKAYSKQHSAGDVLPHICSEAISSDITHFKIL